jgi:hypothetical protein
MMEIFKDSYYYLDLLVGYGSPLLLFLLYRLGKVGARDWKLFWVGAAIGLTWEIPFFLMSKLSSTPIIYWQSEPPVNYLVLMFCHTLWDGALFVVGVWLIGLVCKGPVLERFRWCELAVLIVWGQVTAFMVEFSSVTSDAWIYVEGYWWSPTIMHVGGDPIPALIMLVWFVAVIPFYFIALKFQENEGKT